MQDLVKRMVLEDPYTWTNSGLIMQGQAIILDGYDTRWQLWLGTICWNGYEPSLDWRYCSNYPSPRVSVDLKNLKTGNQYIDDWLDVRLYTRDQRTPV